MIQPNIRAVEHTLTLPRDQGDTDTTGPVTLPLSLGAERLPAAACAAPTKQGVGSRRPTKRPLATSL